MFTRQFTIKYKPLKSNFIILPENYFKLVSSYVSDKENQWKINRKQNCADS